MIKLFRRVAVYKIKWLYFTCLCKAFINKPTMLNSNLLKPPENVRGMTILDKNLFQKNIEVAYANVQNGNFSKVISYFKKYMLKMPNFKSVTMEDVQTHIILNPQKVKKWTDIDSSDRQSLEQLGVSENNIQTKLLTLKYENYSSEDIFRSVLPLDQEGVSSYTKVGHILHVNLREHLFPYKKFVGQVLYDKTPNCKTVVNKINIIDNTYRNFKMEILCGEDNMVAKVKENTCIYEFDFSKVYWNSRLSTEHERIVKRIQPNNVVFDVFSGVGPFAIPSAKKRCIVYANDLNPESYKWLIYNQKLNKIKDEYLKTSCKDGKDFILNEIKDNLLKYINSNDVHIIMNLPGSAVEFLNVFRGFYKVHEIEQITKSVIVHVYCFAKGEDFSEIAKSLVIKNIEMDITDKITEIFKVRTVSNMKEMIRVSFKLDKDILTATTSTLKRKTAAEKIPNKRCVYLGLCEGLLTISFLSVNNGEKEQENKQHI